MTLPFRRRHHDDESVHDRARAIVAIGLLEPVGAEDAAWLEGHLAQCGECSRERAAYLADRSLLRTLRDDPPPPPRDLWVRTAAAIDRERGRSTPARRRARGGEGSAAPSPSGPGPTRSPFRPGGAPLGALSGALVILLVVAISMVPRTGPIATGASPGRSDTAAATPAAPEATPLAVTAGVVGWMRPTADGKVELVLATVDAVCADPAAGCAPLADGSTASITLAAPPESVAISPSADTLVVVPGVEADTTGSVLVVPVPTAPPSETPAPSGSTETGSPAPTAVAESPTASPDTTPAGPTPLPTPEGSRAIATGVTVVGDGAYSPDGRWFAFSARPLDGSTGPDLYLWTAGEPLAVRITDDGATYFSGWAGDRILASHVDAVVPATADPAASAAPAEPAATAPAATAPAATEGHPTSFLLDPVTLERLDLAIGDIWLPSVDPAGRFAAYWTGTLRRDPATGLWEPDAGRLVLDGWDAPLADPLAPAPSATSGVPSAPSIDPSPAATSTAAASAGPSAPPIVGPAGTPVDLVTAPIVAFDARFDPTGTRLAVWTPGEDGGPVGSLRLVVLDPVAGAVVPDLDPLGLVPALRGFSIAEGRLAWVTPPGQDGEASRVAVLGWTGDDFGQANSDSARRLVLVR